MRCSRVQPPHLNVSYRCCLPTCLHVLWSVRSFGPRCGLVGGAVLPHTLLTQSMSQVLRNSRTHVCVTEQESRLRFMGHATPADQKAWHVECSLMRYCHVLTGENDLTALCGYPLRPYTVMWWADEITRVLETAVFLRSGIRFQPGLGSTICPRCTEQRGGRHVVLRSPGDPLRRLYVVMETSSRGMDL